jgi:AmmeMemoRadiSam system protein B
VISPHVDFTRGGPIYSWAYRELAEAADAEVFVVLGVAHQHCRNRFSLSWRDFDTPLGTARCDRDYVEALAERAGAHLFQDEPAHGGEHSIEFQAVFLRHVLGEERDFRIVPILVGSFWDLLRSGIDPIEDPGVRRFIEGLRAVEASAGKKVAYIGGIDLCHVGPDFGDTDPVSASALAEIEEFDQTLLQCAERVEPSRWFGTVAEVGDRWRVCGLAAVYVLLHTISPARGRLLKYAQAVDEKRRCCVTFASLAFDAGAAAQTAPPHAGGADGRA